ncbi:hypothetical protein AVEN_118656-1 [Araneus ventricosus]|uniref:HTH psq-type domain-containing protein n=1 Tax=Araneus ventricosus TaxID=182803 RepID=A0A4Y2AW24_ARAVE|nr:hypothetical protein AVEN_118656-1 [Araneus ventricosus]
MINFDGRRWGSPWPAEGSRAPRTVFFLDRYLHWTHPLPLPSAVFCFYSVIYRLSLDNIVSFTMRKRRALSLKEKRVLKKYDQLPKLSQRKAAGMLNISQPLLNSLLKFRSDIETAVQQNDNLMRKRKRYGKVEDVEDELKECFLKVRGKDTRVSGP